MHYATNVGLRSRPSVNQSSQITSEFTHKTNMTKITVFTIIHKKIKRINNVKICMISFHESF
jgi:hypothetical protein